MEDDERSKVLEMIATDMKNDAASFDGRPFSGKTVAEYFGNQGAAIAALANIVRSLLSDDNKKSNSSPPTTTIVGAE